MPNGSLRFEWDPSKAASNLRKHGVSFEEAASVFSDVLARVYEDPDHSAREERYLTIGTSKQGRLLHISFADRGERIRIINARKVTRKEREFYEKESR
jgi:uncharacterized DUF497 family protein